MTLDDVKKRVERCRKRGDNRTANALLWCIDQIERYQFRRLMSPSQICANTHFQNCDCCERMDCCDNTSPARKLMDHCAQLLKRGKL